MLPHKSRSRTGKHSENLIADYYTQLEYEIVCRNLKTPFAEVDLILKKDNSYFLIEVKTVSRPGLPCLGSQQKIRLQRAFVWLQGQGLNPLVARLVLVGRLRQISQIDNFLCD